MRAIAIIGVELSGLFLFLVGAFLLAFPVGIMAIGLVLLVLGWLLERG